MTTVHLRLLLLQEIQHHIYRNNLSGFFVEKPAAVVPQAAVSSSWTTARHATRLIVVQLLGLLPRSSPYEAPHRQHQLQKHHGTDDPRCCYQGVEGKAKHRMQHPWNNRERRWASDASWAACTTETYPSILAKSPQSGSAIFSQTSSLSSCCYRWTSALLAKVAKVLHKPDGSRTHNWRSGRRARWISSRRQGREEERTEARMMTFTVYTRNATSLAYAEYTESCRWTRNTPCNRKSFSHSKRETFREQRKKERECVRTTLQIAYFRKQITFLFSTTQQHWKKKKRNRTESAECKHSE